MPGGRVPWPFSFRPLANEFGALFNTLAVALNTAGPALVGTATTSIYIGVPADKSWYVAGCSVQGQTVFTGSGAVTMTLFKKSGSTKTALTAAFDLTAAVSSAGYADVPITGSDQSCTGAAGDVLMADVIAAGTFGPTTADLRCVVELAIVA